MKYTVTVLLLSFLSLPFLASAQIVDIPDQGFKDYLIGLGIDANGDGEIQSMEAEAATEIEINDASITSFEGIKSFVNLELFIHQASSVTVVDLSEMPNLGRFEFENTGGVERQVLLSGCSQLLNADFDLLGFDPGVISIIDLTDCSSLEQLQLPTGNTTIDTLILRNCASLERLDWFQAHLLTPLDLSGCNSLRSVDLHSVTGFVPFVFNDLPSLEDIQVMGDVGRLSIVNLPALRTLRYESFDSQHRDLELTDVPELEEIYLWGMLLDEFLLDSQLQLRKVELFNQVQGDIAITNCPNLQEFWTTSTFHRSIDLSGAQSLIFAEFSSGLEPEIVNLTNCTAMEELDFPLNIDTIICNGMSALRSFSYYGNTLEVLELGGCFKLEYADLPWARVESLDFSDCISIDAIDIGQAVQLRSLIVKNGTSETVQFPSGTNLLEICADTDEVLDYVQQLSVDFPNILITDSCPIVNTNRPFLVSGSSYLDVNQDSCMTSTQKLPYSKYSVVSAAGDVASFFAGNSGDYSYFLPEGTYTYMPEVLYGTDLFITYPESNTVQVDSAAQTVVQDFCYISSQDLDIVDVTLIPLEEARPGFDARYRITYANTGSIIKDGDIVLEFPDDVLDLVSASPMVSMQEEGLLTWSFEGLIPFETRSIDFTMNLNSPMEDPALGSGSILNYTARVSPIGNVTITSYWSYLNQEVVNSFDPNDKTCLDGDVLNEELVGQSLKYMIRFENTGTAEAVNVVVIDTLDEASYNIRSLEVLNASHDLRTELEGNVVKFIFEDIYLPFENATNDGYVTFRINTLADLELGHDIQNRAGIYFDFNFPIITNTTTTVVSDLTNVTDLNPGKLNISYYPNPTTRQVQITSDEPIEAIELLTLDGRVCAKYTLAQPVGSYSLPLEGLSPGVYLVSIRSGGKTSTGKLVVQ